MRHPEYYAALDRLDADADERKRNTPRRSPFKTKKTTTGKSNGFIVVFELFKRPVTLRIRNGYATWVAADLSATIFRTRENAKAAIKSYNEFYSHSCKMEKHDIVSVGDAEPYHG